MSSGDGEATGGRRLYLIMRRLVLLLLLSSLTASAHAVSLSLRPCKVRGSDETVRCGDLLVPENPARPDGRHIKLHVVVVPAIHPVAGRAPLFDLAGGPGISATG